MHHHDALTRGTQRITRQNENGTPRCKWGNVRPTMDAFANFQNAKVARCGSMTRDDKRERVRSTTNCPADAEACAFPPRICAQPFLEKSAVRPRQGHKQRVLLAVPSQMDNWTRKQLENAQGHEPGARKACKMPRWAVELGVIGHPRWEKNGKRAFDAHILEDGFRIHK